jgi:hypothetical protein
MRADSIATNGGKYVKRAAIAFALCLAASLACAEAKAAFEAGSLGFTANVGWTTDEQIGVIYNVTDKLVVNPFFLFNPWKENPLPVNPGQENQNKGNILGIGTWAFYETPVSSKLIVGIGGIVSYRLYDDLFETLYSGTSYKQDNAWKTFYLDFGPSVRAQYMVTPKVGVFFGYTIYCTYYHSDYDQKDTMMGTEKTNEYGYFSIVNDASRLGLALYL